MNGQNPLAAAALPPPDDGCWIRTYTGRQFWPLSPRAEHVDIEDIAHALGNMCRFGGHTARFYSVAEHSWWVSQIVPKEDALWGLLHDAAEAYLVDVPTPIKPHIPGWAQVERAVEQVVAEAFGLPWPMPMSVKDADRRILQDETFQLMSAGGGAVFPDAPLGLRLDCWPSYMAEAAFLDRFYELTRQMPVRAPGVGDAH